MAFKVTILPYGKVIEAASGSSLLELLQGSGVYIESLCSGRGFCGRCIVEVIRGGAPPEDREVRLLGVDRTGAGLRLACISNVTSDMKLTIVDEFKPFLDEKKQEKIPERAPSTLLGIEEDEYLIRVGDNRVVIGKVPGPPLGFAVDAGTTMIETILVDLTDGSIKGGELAFNRQMRAGTDMVSRISYGTGSEKNREKLRVWLIESIEETIQKLQRAGGADRGNCIACSISGNVFIMHSLLGKPLSGLARFPFSPPLTDELVFPDRLPLSIHPGGATVLFPAPGAFIGGDLVAGTISLSLDREGSPALFLDIGTNTEVLVRKGRKWIAASVPSGGAFEGAAITCGKMALPGAVTGCHYDSELFLQVAGGKEPDGISGSGLVSLAALLISHGIVTGDGRLLTPAEARGSIPGSLLWRLTEMDGENAFIISLPERGGVPLYLTQSDVRNFQKAKGATRAGLETALKEAGLDRGEVEKVYLSGAFGMGVDDEALIVSGMMPREFEGKLVKAGNTSLKGAYLNLVEEDVILRAKDFSGNVEVLHLGGNELFSRTFIEYLNF